MIEMAIIGFIIIILFVFIFYKPKKDVKDIKNLQEFLDYTYYKNTFNEQTAIKVLKEKQKIIDLKHLICNCKYVSINGARGMFDYYKVYFINKEVVFDKKEQTAIFINDEKTILVVEIELEDYRKVDGTIYVEPKKLIGMYKNQKDKIYQDLLKTLCNEPI